MEITTDDIFIYIIRNGLIGSLIGNVEQYIQSEVNKANSANAEKIRELMEKHKEAINELKAQRTACDRMIARLARNQPIDDIENKSEEDMKDFEIANPK